MAYLQQKYIDLLEKRIGQLEDAVKGSASKAAEGSSAASGSDPEVLTQLGRLTIIEQEMLIHRY